MSASGGERILVVGPAWVGDMVMADSLFRLLKARDPQAHLCVVAPPSTAPLLDFLPAVDQVERLAVASGKAGLSARWRLGRRLRREGFQRALVLPRSWKSALLPAIAGVPRRIGYRGELRWGLLSEQRRFDREAVPRSVDRFLALALPEGAPLPETPLPRMVVPEGALEAALTATGLARPTQSLLALCPGAAYGPAKRWPAGHFAELAKAWSTHGGAVWVFGQKQDQAAAAEILAAAPSAASDLTGRTDLAGAVALLSLATQVVSNDSGLMHVAAALARPLVALYGSSTAVQTPPLSPEAQVLGLDLPCRPCHQRQCPLGHLRCLTELSPAMVLEALERPQERYEARS
ncbi:MAG: lipopolysaccharide heptosyltransferase II [Rhodospirillales bacterium]